MSKRFLNGRLTEERMKQGDRQADRLTDRMTSRQTDRVTSRQTNIEWQADRQTVLQADRQVVRQKDKERDRQTNKQTIRQIGRTQKTNSSKISRKGEFSCHWTFCKETYYVYYNFHDSSLVIFVLGLQLIDERFEKVLFLLNSLLTVMIIYILQFKDTNITYIISSTYKTIMICTY